MTKLTSWILTAVELLRLPHRTITADPDEQGYCDPYLTRIYLTPDADWWRKTLGMPGVFLHFFHRGDYERELHNHPWAWAWSFVLTGGYWDYRLEYGTGEVVRRKIIPGDLNRIGERTFHRVDLLDEERGAWTIFVAGPGKTVMLAGEEIGFWGFLGIDGTGFELWKERDRRIRKTGQS